MKFAPETYTIVPPIDVPNVGSIECTKMGATNENMEIEFSSRVFKKEIIPLFDICSAVVVGAVILGVTHLTIVSDNQVANVEIFPKKHDKVFMSLKL